LATEIAVTVSVWAVAAATTLVRALRSLAVCKIATVVVTKLRITGESGWAVQWSGCQCAAGKSRS
jgi:hypothetical protein